MVGVVLPLITELERSVPLVARVNAFTLVTVPFALDDPAPIAVLKSVSLKDDTVLSALILKNLIALGLVKLIKFPPTVVGTKDEF
jgi:hypothetical protein